MDDWQSVTADGIFVFMGDLAVEQAKPRGNRRVVLRPFLLWIVSFVVFVLFQNAETVWLLFLLWLPLYASWRWRWWIGCSLLPLSGATLVLHTQGYKLVGYYTVEENRPYEPDGYIAAFGPGPVVVLTDGRTIRLSGLSAAKNEQGQQALDDHWLVAGLARERRVNAVQSTPSQSGSSRPKTWRMMDGIWSLWETAEGIPVRLLDQGDGTSRVFIAHRRPDIYCGNSLSEEFFPPRYPLFTPQGLAETLLDQREVVVADGSTKDPAYRQQLATHIPKRR